MPVFSKESSSVRNLTFILRDRKQNQTNPGQLGKNNKDIVKVKWRNKIVKKQ